MFQQLVDLVDDDLYLLQSMKAQHHTYFGERCSDHSGLQHLRGRPLCFEVCPRENSSHLVGRGGPKVPSSPSRRGCLSSRDGVGGNSAFVFILHFFAPPTGTPSGGYCRCFCWFWWCSFLQRFHVCLVQISDSIGRGTSMLELGDRRHAETYRCVGTAGSICAHLLYLSQVASESPVIKVQRTVPLTPLHPKVCQ